jgi:hypothetical protein
MILENVTSIELKEGIAQDDAFEELAENNINTYAGNENNEDKRNDGKDILREENIYSDDSVV